MIRKSNKYHIIYNLAFFILITFFSDSWAQQEKNVDSLYVNSLPSISLLPNPLTIQVNGQFVPITHIKQWIKKRNIIKKQYQFWISGSFPPSPKDIDIKILSNEVKNDITIRKVELRFGPKYKAKMTIELMIPNSKGKLPVFMTQWNHRGWAQIAVKRGYIGCVYAGADAKDDTKNYDKLYPKYDFATLMKRAWGASRVVDYLYTLAKVDTNKIAIIGHSRNGKQSLMAAAFDYRIDAVISSSGGTGGESTFRYSDDRFTPGSFDKMLVYHPKWFVSRLHWFVGREDKLPVDQNSLMSLIAPRGLMMVSAITEHEGNPWGVEQSFKSVKKVYHFLQADSSIAILLRRGRHQHAARDIEKYIDFFDYIFNRSPTAPENKLYYDYSFSNWRNINKKVIKPLDFPKHKSFKTYQFNQESSFKLKQDSLRKLMCWLMGNELLGVLNKKDFSSGLKNNSTYKDDYLSEVIGQVNFKDSVKTMKFGPYTPLGNDLWGNIYFPSKYVRNDSVTSKAPLIIYLHKYEYATGFRNIDKSYVKQLCRNGYAVLTFDMIGFGTRIEEAKLFYNRYPHWSLMGKMVSDLRYIIDDVVKRMRFINSKEIYLTGYSLGGTVALFTAALDKRVKGIAVVSAFSSLRNDNETTEGIRRYYKLHGLLPRLGYFKGYENRIPLEFEDIMACIAPRSLLVIQPKFDRNHTYSIVKNETKIIADLYDKYNMSNNFTVTYPNTYSHFTSCQKNIIVNWLNQDTNKY